MSPTEFIQPAFFHELFEKQSDHILKVKAQHEAILTELNLLDRVKEIGTALQVLALPATPRGDSTEGTNAGGSQEQVIEANVMPAMNYVMHSLQSFIVSSKQFVNWSAEKVLGQGTIKKFDFSKQEDLEVVRKELTKDSLTISEVANLFEVNGEDLKLKDRVVIPELFKKDFNKIKELLKAELTKDDGDLGANLKKLQEGKGRWYDFDSLENTNYPKTVEIFKTWMACITNLLINAISIVKGVANWVYHFHKEGHDLFDKTSSELVSDLNRGRGNHAIDWANLRSEVKKQGQERE